MSRYTLKISDRQYIAEVKEISADTARIEVDGTEYTVDLVELGRHQAEPPVRPTAPSPAAAGPATPAPSRSKAAPAAGGSIPAPLPGLVLQLKVAEGDQVSAGQCLLVMEAMKMENQITAPHNGSVKKIHVAEGDNVGEGDALIEVARPEMTTL